MNNKEFVALMAEKNGTSLKDTSSLLSGLVAEMGNQFEDGASISLTGFGTFEVKKKLERVVVNPSTKRRMLVPPKLVLTFKPSSVLKDKI